MEYEPYPAQVNGLVIQQLTQGAGWVDLIEIPIEEPHKATPEQIQAAIEAIHNLFYGADKLELSVQGVQLCIRGIDKGATFRIIASPDVSDKPQFVG